LNPPLSAGGQIVPSIVPDAPVSVAYFRLQYEALKRAFAAAR
jgi:hypothetical protein